MQNVSAISREASERDRIASVGMTVFLASWVIMFASLFFGYAALRLRAPQWPPAFAPDLEVWPTFANSLVLAASDLVFTTLARENSVRYRTGVLLATVLGAAFFLNQFYLWSLVWNEGLRPDSGTYGSVYYTLTAFHALHVLVGIGLFLWLAWKSSRWGAAHDCSRATAMVRRYWRFVGIAWGAIFVSVYLI